MIIKRARINDINKIKEYDAHIDSINLVECIKNQLVYVLKDKTRIVGVLRYNFFWQTIPFLDLIFIDISYQNKGYGKYMMDYWEKLMKDMGFKSVMLSTQEDETAKFFYEKIGYKRIGKFLPPNQDAYELMYSKVL